MAKTDSLSRALLAAAIIAITCGALELQAAETTAETKDSSLKPGLTWVHFHTFTFGRPRDMGVDPQINLGTGKTIQGFSRVWMGVIRCPVSGEITFSAEADNGMQLVVGGQTVIDGWGLREARTGKIGVKVDELLPLRVRFFQDGGTAYFRLYWSWQGRKRELVPASAFWHRENDLKRAQSMLDGKLRPQLSLTDKGTIYLPGRTEKTARKTLI